MTIPTIFNSKETEKAIERLEKIQPNDQPKWGKMNAPQMLAHLNVAYEVTYGERDVKLNGFTKFMLKAFVKKSVVNEKPYKRNLRTADFFVIADEREFEKEKQRLIDYIRKTEQLGASHFEGLESVSFGKMTAREWNNQFYKHMDHHFQQFGV